jgi:hypothetical protein
MRALRRVVVAGATCMTVVGGSAVAVTMTSGPAAAETDSTGCSTGDLPAYVDGRPEALAPGAARGDYVWHSDNGWNLAVTHPQPGRNKVVFTGTIRTSRPIEFVEVRDEKNDTVALSGDRMTMTFRFTNYGHIDGVRFRVSCARSVHFSLAADSHQLSPTQVYLGREGRHPSSTPFAIERR